MRRRKRIVKRGRNDCEIYKFIARAASHSLRNDEYRATQRCTGKRLNHFPRQSMKVTPTQFFAISSSSQARLKPSIILRKALPASFRPVFRANIIIREDFREDFQRFLEISKRFP